ncbi:WhiB family transcriptional regulator [Rhodococcus sp. NPDC059968]|uniref:WhiB family transcriptional regulator n=1 Tax=Rhodococcus sp. NPDC059968 TaxID=3347017 RepID=UPI00366D585C
MHAHCRPTVEHLFFPPDGESTGARVRRVAAAKRICANCQVLGECRQYAARHGEFIGVWGGLSERERKDTVAVHDVVDTERSRG